MARKIEQVTEWWAAPIDVYGDSLEVYYCNSKLGAIAERKKRESDHANEATSWRLEKVVRRYASDGELVSEEIMEQEW